MLQREPGCRPRRSWSGYSGNTRARLATAAADVERRVRQWKAQQGPAKEVFFSQVHEPGRLGSSDFTHMDELGVTHRRATVSAPAVPLRADLLELGARDVVLLGELRQPE